MTEVFKLSIAGLLLCVFILPGCYGKRIYEIESRLDDQDRDIAGIEDSLEQVTGAVAHLDSTVGPRSAPLRSSRAISESRIDELQTRLEILEALVKENRYRIAQISMRREPHPAEQDAAGTPGSRAPADTSMLQASVATHLYETAYVDFVKGNFQSAISGFRDFVGRFPMTDFSDDAQFMIAQSFFVLGEYSNAVTEFRKVLDEYPSGDKVPEAMYKLGLSYLELDDTETAREYFKILVTRYPTAVEAKQAQEMLDSLPPPSDDEGI
jgi:tol-pal system protein YbgF